MIFTRNAALLIIMVYALLGCAAPEPMMISPGVYIVSRTSAAGSVFANMAQLKADTIDAANRFAKSKGKEAIAVSLRDERPIPGFPLVEYQFRLVEPGLVSNSSVILNKDSKATIQRNDDLPNKTEQATPKESSQNLNTDPTEAESTKKKQAELESQLKLTQLQPQIIDPSTTASSLSRRIALVVGNANYKTRPLRNPRNDADDVSIALKASGFQVIDLRDASLQQMRAGVRQFGDRLINNDVGLVYFSGHGVEVRGRNYFIPVNADIMREDEIADQGLDVSLILEKMNTAGKGVNILIVDACRDDPFGRSFRSSSRGLAQMDAPKGTIIAYATSPGKVAADGDGRNSPYTKNLVKVMQQPNMPIEQVFKEVRRAVQEETKNQQTPWENTSLSGDFYFKVQR